MSSRISLPQFFQYDKDRTNPNHSNDKDNHLHYDKDKDKGDKGDYHLHYDKDTNYHLNKDNKCLYEFTYLQECYSVYGTDSQLCDIISNSYLHCFKILETFDLFFSIYLSNQDL